MGSIKEMPTMTHIKYLSIVLLLFGAALTTLGQERKITEDELNSLISVSVAKQKGKTFRQTISSTGIAPDDHSETIYEFGPDHAFHALMTRKSGGVETRTEFAFIGNYKYERQSDGTWSKQELPAPGSSQAAGGSAGGSDSGASPVNIDTTTEFLFLGTETSGKDKTDHYLSRRKMTYASGSLGRTRYVVKEYWFRADGLLLKERFDDFFAETDTHLKTAIDFDYDKEVKIVAPIE